MKNLLNKVYLKDLNQGGLKLVNGTTIVSGDFHHCALISFEGREFAVLGSADDSDLLRERAKNLAPLFLNLDLNIKVLKWIHEIKMKYPTNCNWIGLYYKSSFILNENNTDLILGPYIGASTEHIRIPLDRGLCGLALKENRTVNVDDVQSNPLYLSCSLETKSEIVIPLYDKTGKAIAELDIDAHMMSAFDENTVCDLEAICAGFHRIL